MIKDKVIVFNILNYKLLKETKNEGFKFCNFY